MKVTREAFTMFYAEIGCIDCPYTHNFYIVTTDDEVSDDVKRDMARVTALAHDCKKANLN